MTTPIFNLFMAALVVAVFQVLAAIPWVWAFDGRPFRKWIADAKVLGYIGGAIVAIAVLLCVYFRRVGDIQEIEKAGRYLGSFLHLQLIADFVVLAPRLLLLIWPKGGAVATAALRESLRQPMFWLIFGLSVVLIAISTILPYFTLGDDYKLMKHVGFDIIMLSSGLLGLMTASIAVNEEIEGRTAITVISKPVSRRQFLIGKYLGILMACWIMALLLGWALTWALRIRPDYDPLDDVVDPMPYEVSEWLAPKVDRLVPTVEGSAMARGIGVWFGQTLAHHIGMVRVFGAVMILLSICTALATRVQFVVNLVICLGFFLIGNLSPIMVHVTDRPENEGNAALGLVRFIAQLFNAVFPSLDSFDMGPAIIRDTPLSTISFLGFVGTVLLYAAIYTAISILVGLLLFEDKDLA
ncbi:MAG TPA: ABC transporter permease subunit [Gemmataceae bacterium]|nr:ABC transporter permease subunit [Gemmataceae bacterium]